MKWWKPSVVHAFGSCSPVIGALSVILTKKCNLEIKVKILELAR